MKAVGDDAGIGEPTFDHRAVRAGEIDADHADPLAALPEARIPVWMRDPFVPEPMPCQPVPWRL